MPMILLGWGNDSNSSFVISLTQKIQIDFSGDIETQGSMEFRDPKVLFCGAWA